MSDKDRRLKDGERKDGDRKEMHEAEAARSAGQKPPELPRDKSNHLIGDDETAEQLQEDAS